jgi:hypothetical protein
MGAWKKQPNLIARKNTSFGWLEYSGKLTQFKGF